MAGTSARSSLKTRGIIVSEKMVGEQDKLLTLLCVDHGKLTVSAKGAKKQGAKLSGGTQLFFYNDFLLDQGRGYTTIRELSVIEGFYELRTDLDRMAAASVMAETAALLSLPGENCNDLLKLLLRGFQALRNPQLQTRTTMLTFVLRALGQQGLRPDLDQWYNDKKRYLETGNILYYQVQTAGLTPDGILTLRHIFDADEEKVYQYRLSDDLLEQLLRFMKSYLYQYSEKEMNSLRFLESL